MGVGFDRLCQLVGEGFQRADEEQAQFSHHRNGKQEGKGQRLLRIITEALARFFGGFMEDLYGDIWVPAVCNDQRYDIKYKISPINPPAVLCLHGLGLGT